MQLVKALAADADQTSSRQKSAHQVNVLFQHLDTWTLTFANISSPYSWTGMHRYDAPRADSDYFGLVRVHLEPTSGHPLVDDSNASFQLVNGVSCVRQLAVDIQLSIIRMHVYVDTRPSQQLCPRVHPCTTQRARDPRLSLAGLNMLDAQRQTWRSRM